MEPNEIPGIESCERVVEVYHGFRRGVEVTITVYDRGPVHSHRYRAQVVSPDHPDVTGDYLETVTDAILFMGLHFKAFDGHVAGKGGQ